jgi:hypothetical protein
MTYYDAYFDIQHGNGRQSGIERVYVGAPNQRGHGIGSFLGGLFRRVLPLLSKGAKAIGKEVARSGMNVFHDVIQRDIPFKEAFNNRMKDTAENLKRKAEEKIDILMEGSGYKTLRTSNIEHLINTRDNEHIVKQRKKKKPIYSGKAPKTKTSTLKKKKKKKKKKIKKKSSIRNKRTVVDIFH